MFICIKVYTKSERNNTTINDKVKPTNVLCLTCSLWQRIKCIKISCGGIKTLTYYYDTCIVYR